MPAMAAVAISQPNTNISGTFAAALSFHAWDQSTGTDGGTASVTGNPACSFSVDGAAITITPINNPPMATNLSTVEVYTEDTPLNLVDIVTSDVDSPTLTHIFGGVLHLSLPEHARSGTRFYRHRATGWDRRPDAASLRAQGDASFLAFQKRRAGAGVVIHLESALIRRSVLPCPRNRV